MELALVLVELGTILVFGVVGAHFLRKYGIPQVLGLIVSGILLGVTNQHYELFTIDLDVILTSTTSIALGIIGFNLGSELKWEELKKIEKKMFAILLADSVGTFLIVTSLIFLLTDLKLTYALIFGALASATAPAATADVIWEYKSSGPLTQAILFILALDDIMAILLIEISFQFAKGEVEGTGVNLSTILIAFVWEVGGGVVIGGITGVLTVWGLSRVKDHGDLLELIFGALILVTGLSMYLEVSSILSCMIYGIIVASFPSEDTTAVFHDIFKIGSPFVAIFFIIAGLAVDISDLILIGELGIIYLLGRTLGKVGAVSITGKLVNASEEIQKYLGFCLFSQAGVALGLAAQIYEEFHDLGSKEAAEAGSLILTTIMGTILIVQLLGPLMVKWAIHQAGEISQDEVIAIDKLFTQEG
ncbi:MAG: cation:proton antiporter [Promethearchaeota archaeon]